MASQMTTIDHKQLYSIRAFVFGLDLPFSQQVLKSPQGFYNKRNQIDLPSNTIILQPRVMSGTEGIVAKNDNQT